MNPLVAILDSMLQAVCARMDDLRATLNAIPADAVVSASPSDLGRLMALEKPVLARYYKKGGRVHGKEEDRKPPDA